MGKIDIEETVLFEIFQAGKDEQLSLLGELRLKDFTVPKWAKLFRVFCEIAVTNQRIDLVNAYQRAKEFITVEEISEKSDFYNSTGYVDQHIKLLKQHTYKREVYKIAQSAVKEIKETIEPDEVESIKGKLIASLSALSVFDNSNFVDFDEVRNQLFANMDKNDTGIEGFSWGSNDLNGFTSGIVIPRLYILGGLKKGGKSRFVINLIGQLSRQKVKNTFMSLEMPAYEIVKLIHSHFSEITDIKLRSKSFISREERHRLYNAEIPKEYFSIECVSGIGIEGVTNRIKRYASLGSKVIFIDYLQRIKQNKDNSANELSGMSNAIADATRLNNVAVILLSQLQNIAERETPSIGHLKGSGGIGESADSILLFDNLYRRTKQEVDKNKIDIYLEQRYGDSGVIHLQSDLGTCHIRDLETNHEDE